MSATSVLAPAQAAPGLYAAVGSFSGCAQTGTDPGRRFVQAVVASGGGNPWNANVEKLRGTELFVSARVPRPGGATDGPAVADPAGGGALESVVAQCTRRLQEVTE